MTVPLIKPALPTSFAHRTAPAALPELMDGEVDTATLEGCLRSLASVNWLSSGYRPTLGFVDRLAARHRAGRLRILDVGSGYGDPLRAVGRRLAARGIAADLVGADLNPDAVRIATAATPAGASHPDVSITFVVRDARELAADEPFDAIISSLFTHHLEDAEVVEFVRFMEAHARLGWFVNDLYRSAFAAHGFALATRLTRRHPFVRHDGPVSFARAFRRADWNRLLAAAGVAGASVAIRAPFRLCVERLRDG